MMGRSMRDRGQTPTDFILGVTLFLATVGAVFALTPTLFGAPVVDSVDGSVISERAADHLQDGILVEPRDSTGELSRVCSRAFFNKSSAPRSSCAFDTSRELRVLVGAPEHVMVNVTVTDIETGSVVTVDGVAFQRGDRVSSTARGIETAARTVILDGDPARLTVRAWGVRR